VRSASVAVLALVTAAPAFAQPAAYLAEVAADNVLVRCGPSEQMPETGSLFRGTRVVVDHEEPGDWLAIQPPRGQVSWVRSVHLHPKDDQPTDMLPRNAVVYAESESEIAYGRPGLGKPLDVRRTKIPDSTVVTIIGKKVEAGGVWWYPIEPPDGDFRYVPKSAVRFVRGQPAQSFVVREPKPGTAPPETRTALEPVAASVPGPAGGTKPADWPTNPLWRQAEQAERSGDYPRAENLYLKLAAEMNQPGGDPDLANLCYARVHAVREKQRNAPRGGSGTTVATADPNRRDLPPAGQWVGPGVLRVAGFRIDNRPTFALVGSRNEVKCYAVAGPGVDLDRFRGSEVELFGKVNYPGDLRGAGVMTATRVQAPR
jgi:hypothetical protein